MNQLDKAREYEKKRMRDISDEDRPAYHLSPAAGWMNDPNGFSCFGGKYHLFYQYYPYETNWGPMHWGHAVSEDFIRWEYLPAALAPDEDYESGCFSGSAVETPDGKHLLMYTAHWEDVSPEDKKRCESQCMAVGDGINYVKYQGNPVLTQSSIPDGSSPEDFRDPKIWKDEDGYHAVIASRAEDGFGQVLLFSSTDGYGWRFVSVLEKCRNEYGEMWECPDLFPLDGKHVLLISAMNMKNVEWEFHSGHEVIAFVGGFDKKSGRFIRERVQSMDYGFDFYAPQTIMAEDGRRIMTAWMQSWESSKWQPEGSRWFGMTIVPRELTIRDGRICQLPVRELEDYRTNKAEYTGYLLSGEKELDGISGRVADVEVTLYTDDGDTGEFSVKLAAQGEVCTRFVYNITEDMVCVDRSRSGLRHDIVSTRRFPVKKRGGKVRFRFLVDRYSIELFVNDGEQAFSTCIYDTPRSAAGISFFSDTERKIDVVKYDILTGTDVKKKFVP